MTLEKIASGGRGDLKRIARLPRTKNLVTEAEAEDDLAMTIIVAPGMNLEARAKVKSQIKVLLIAVELAAKRNCIVIGQKMLTGPSIESIGI